MEQFSECLPSPSHPLERGLGLRQEQKGFISSHQAQPELPEPGDLQSPDLQSLDLQNQPFHIVTRWEREAVSQAQDSHTGQKLEQGHQTQAPSPIKVYSAIQLQAARFGHGRAAFLKASDLGSRGAGRASFIAIFAATSHKVGTCFLHLEREKGGVGTRRNQLGWFSGGHGVRGSFMTAGAFVQLFKSCISDPCYLYAD